MSEYLIVKVFKKSFKKKKKKKKIEFNRFSLISTKYSISVRVPKIQKEFSNKEKRKYLIPFHIPKKSYEG